MSDVVLDASAVPAPLRDKRGADTVAAHIGRAAISAVNLEEVIKEILREGATLEAAHPVLGELALALHPHDEKAAYAAAALHAETKVSRSGSERPLLHGAGAHARPACAHGGPGVEEHPDRGSHRRAGA